MSSMVTPSTPGAPRLARTSPQALSMTSLRATLSKRAWKRRSLSCLAQRYSTRWRARTRSTPWARLTDLADTALIKSLCSFSCIDEARGPLPCGRLSRPRTTTTRSDCRSAPCPFPGSPVIGGHRFPSPRRRRGQDGSPEFPGRPSARSTPNYAGGSLSARFWIPGAFHGLRRECTGSAPSTPARRRAHLTTLAQASLALQTARSHPSCFAPGLSTTHEDIATRDPDVSPDRTHTGRPS